MFAPNAMPSGSPPVKSAAAARPRSITSSAAARCEGAAQVRVRVAQDAGHRVDHALRNLRAARAVEEGGPGGERRELGADGGDVEHPATLPANGYAA